MKKIILINNIYDVCKLESQKKKFEQIIVLDYEAAILCFKKKIKFKYIKDIYHNKKNKNIAELLVSSYQYAKKIDKNIIRSNINFKNLSFFSNYYNFAKGFVFLNRYYDYLDFISKKYKNYEINYYANFKINTFDFFIETIKIFINKKRNKFKRTIIKNKQYQNFYFNNADDPQINKFRKIFSYLNNYNFSNKKIILFYLLEKKYLNIIKDFTYNKKIYLKNFNELNKKDKKFSLKKINFLKLDRNLKPKEKILKKYVNFIGPQIIKTVMDVNEKVLDLINKKEIKIFVTSHNTLISNTIKDVMLKNKKSALTFLHGGTIGHFNNNIFWPTLSIANQNKNKKSYYQIYSSIQKKRSVSLSEKYKVNNKKNQFLNFGSESFKDLYNLKKREKNKNHIAYIMQSNNNLAMNCMQNKNDPYNLFLQRNYFFNKIKRDEIFKVSISSPENDLYTVANKDILDDLIDKKRLFLHKMNAIQILRNASIVILEQQSTTLIEALCLGVPTIYLLKNQVLGLNNTDYKNLKKRVIFINSLEDIDLKKIHKNIKNDDSFLKNYYSMNKKNEFLSIFHKII